MKLKEILSVCKNFVDNPNDEVAMNEYNELLIKTVVRAYLPMQEKVIALVRMVMDSDKDIDVPASMFTAGLEIACLFDGLLSYVNIDPEVDLEIKNYENYDILYQSGFADYVLDFCARDYERLVHMMERTFSFENLTELTSSMRELNTGSLVDLKVAIQQSIKDADPSIIKNIADIMRLNDPNLMNLKTEMENLALEKKKGEIEKETKVEAEEVETIHIS